jgi:hypothetical protein
MVSSPTTQSQEVRVKRLFMISMRLTLWTATPSQAGNTSSSSGSNSSNEIHPRVDTVITDDEQGRRVYERRVYRYRDGEHEVLWGRLVTGRLHKVSGQTKPGCETPTLPKRTPSEPKAPEPPQAPEVLQFKIWLLGISPMIWRRIQVPHNMTLRELHGVIQVAMG